MFSSPGKHSQTRKGGGVVLLFCGGVDGGDDDDVSLDDLFFGSCILFREDFLW